MHLAVPIHRGRISPLFDTAKLVLLLSLEDGREISREEIHLDGNHGLDRIESIVQAGADSLVCGAISDFALLGLLRRGLLVWPAVAGDVEDVIQALASSGELDGSFEMPGSRRMHGARGAGGPVRHEKGAWGWHALADGKGGIRRIDLHPVERRA